MKRSERRDEFVARLVLAYPCLGTLDTLHLLMPLARRHKDILRGARKRALTDQEMDRLARLETEVHRVCEVLPGVAPFFAEDCREGSVWLRLPDESTVLVAT